jgi:PAS domain S-box-containing protein
MATILIVDDRPINREALSLLLNEHNYEVIEAEDGIQAIELAHAYSPNLIITDIAMPRMDGFALIKHLQAQPVLTNIPVIFYSANYKATDSYHLAQASNVKYVLTKPCDPEIILKTIEITLKSNSQSFNGVFPPLEDIVPTKLLKKEKLEKTNLRLTNIIEIGLDMSQEHDIERLTYIMCKASRQFLNASYAGIIMQSLENPTQYKNFVVSQNNSMNFYEIESKNLSPTLTEIFLGEKNVCMHSPIIDVSKIGLSELTLPFSSLLSLPVKTVRGYYGKVYFINKFNQKFFTPSDQRFLMTLADKFAIIYENLMLYREVERHTEQLEDEIAQRKQTESFLQEVTDRLHLSLEAANVGTWSWSIQDNQLSWDKYACLLFGLEPEAYVGTLETFLEHIVFEDREQVRQELLAISKNNKSQPVEFKVIWPDKTIHHLMLRGKMNYNTEGQSVRMLGVYWDITEHIQAEEKLRVYREKMSEVVRSNSLGEVASSLAHEINQPLAAIAAYVKGCIKRIENKNEVTPEIIDTLHETALQVERVGEVVHRIKSFVRKGELFYEIVDIDFLIEATIAMMKLETQRYAARIIHVKNKKNISIEVDKIQLQQVILNLSRNAMEAMQEAHTKNPQIMIESIQNEENRIMIRILDNGPGFSENTAKHLFDLYFTTKLHGMGLGLAICRSIIEAHTGQLSASVLPKGGSCFQFDIPLRKHKIGNTRSSTADYQLETLKKSEYLVN